MELIFPTMGHKQSILEYRKEWLDCVPGEGINGSWGLQRKEYENYDKWLSDIKGLMSGKVIILIQVSLPLHILRFMKIELLVTSKSGII